jgi:hypothetical protein
MGDNDSERSGFTREFTRDQSQDAFTALVQRHLIWSAPRCVRSLAAAARIAQSSSPIAQTPPG